jgi:hypothetical protein
MLTEKGELMARPSAEKKAYQTPALITHGSVAKLTQNSAGGGHSDMSIAPWGCHHRYRWWDHI